MRNMRKALVVGINEYPDTPLYCCVNDAYEVASMLKTNGDGSPNFHVNVLSCRVDKAELLREISSLFKGDDDVEVALLYFSGHGYIGETGGFIVTSDMSEYSYGISMDEILVMANKSRIRNRVILLDCCYSGNAGSPEIAAGSSVLNKGVTIMSSSKPSEVSIEVNGHGVFTNLLINSLKGSAADIMGNITIGGVYAHIDQALGPFDQRPTFKTNVTNFLSLRQVKPSVPTEVIRKLVHYFPSPDYCYDLDPSYEYTNSHEIEHIVTEPYANPMNVGIFKELQSMEKAGLIKPVGADHMYFAAMNSQKCCLTSLGKHYHLLASKNLV